jgi:hypothetical protein
VDLGARYARRRIVGYQASDELGRRDIEVAFRGGRNRFLQCVEEGKETPE